MRFEIKNRYNGSIIYQDEAESFSALIKSAVKAGADLYGANLRGANLGGAALGGADLYGADLGGAKNISDKLNAESSIVPEVGQFEGWKKCRDNVIVRVLIPKKAKRSNATGRKCRASEIKVLEVIGATKGISTYNESVTYTKGKTVKCDKWNKDRWIECGGGIHFFLTRLEAEQYN